MLSKQPLVPFQLSPRLGNLATIRGYFPVVVFTAVTVGFYLFDFDFKVEQREQRVIAVTVAFGLLLIQRIERPTGHKTPIVQIQFAAQLARDGANEIIIPVFGVWAEAVPSVGSPGSCSARSFARCLALRIAAICSGVNNGP